jgi:hypothetical protein
MILCPFKIFVFSIFKILFSKKKDLIDQMRNKLHMSIAKIVTDCSKMRTDIFDLATSVNSVVSMLKIITKHLDSGLINCGIELLRNLLTALKIYLQMNLFRKIKRNENFPDRCLFLISMKRSKKCRKMFNFI